MTLFARCYLTLLWYVQDGQALKELQVAGNSAVACKLG